MEHMEIYWMMVSCACMIAETSVMGYVLYRFAKPFMENEKRTFCIGIAYFFTMLILYLIPFVMNNFMAYSIGILAAFIVMCKADHRNYCQKIFIAVTFFSLRWLSAYMTEIITEAVYHLMIETSYMEKHPVFQLVAYIAAEILSLMVEFEIIKISVKYIIKTYIYKHENMTIKEMFVLIVPSMTGIIGYGIMQYYQTYFEMSAGKAVSGIYNGLALLYYGISIITVVIMTVLFQSIKARQEEALQNKLFATQIESIKQHIEQVERLYQDIRSIKHDMTNHILTLEKLYIREETKEAKDYVQNLKAALIEVAGEIQSGNPVTDVILRERKNEAVKKKIDFYCDFYYPTDSNVNAFDVSVILNNALQNAVENVGKSETPYISIISYCKNNAYMIEISNSFTGNLQWDNKSQLLLTSKEKTDSHGYGLINIRKVARKYSGDIDIVQKDGEFRLSIMLMLER